MDCGQCQAPNPAGNAFCHACGAPVGAAVATDVSQRVCPRCGSSNQGHIQFCIRCGNDISGEVVAGLPSSPAPRQSLTSRPPLTGGAGPNNSRPPPEGSAATCSRCHQPLEGGARFCKHCGAPVGSASEPAVSSSLTARVVVILRDGSEGGVYPLSGLQTDVGSREGEIVLQDDPYLSPRHARIARRGDTFSLLDLGSINGIYLRIRHPTPLADADMILVGQQVLRFEMIAEAERQVGPAMQHGVMVFGTPEAPRIARLSQYTTEGLLRDVYYLHREETIMGREQADIVFSDDPFLSRRHAVISSESSGGFSANDLGSSNGTFLRCRAEHELTSGDQFRVGRHLLRFDLVAGGSTPP